jgi:hypothetical protein
MTALCCSNHEVADDIAFLEKRTVSGTGLIAKSLAAPVDDSGEPRVEESKDASKVLPQASPEVRQKWESAVGRDQGDVFELLGVGQETSLTSSLVVYPLEKVPPAVFCLLDRSPKTDTLLFNVINSARNSQQQQASRLEYPDHFAHAAGIAVLPFYVFDHRNRVNHVESCRSIRQHPRVQ